MNPVELLPNPDDVGQSEYRAIYEHLKDTLDDCPQSERMDLAIAMLCEFEEWARHIKGRLKESSKKAK
jgi:hypothetical protein